MKKLQRNMLFIFVTALAVYTSFTLLQIYYSVYIHLFLFAGCLIFSCKRYKYIIPAGIGGVVCALFFLFAIDKTATSPMEQLGFYLHYITWPIVLIAVTNTFTLKQKMVIMRILLVVSVISSILSLRVLLFDSNVSRLLAGSATQSEKLEYYSRGVGGYGTVFATAFLCFGEIYWLMHTKVKGDKVLIVISFIINFIFILYASYTTAIIIAAVLTFLAFTSKMKSSRTFVVLAIAMLVLLVFGDSLISLVISFMEKLELEWVVRRLSELLEASETTGVNSLNRAQLYMKSFNTFLEHPLKGGSKIGEHSQILDNLAIFGLMGVLMPLLFCYYAYKCIKLSNKKLILFYLAFIVFAAIDTCDVMQIPVVIFFLCPLIINAIKEQENNNNNISIFNESEKI